MSSSFKIGSTYGGMVTLDALSAPLDDPKSNYRPFAKTLLLGNGSAKGMGFPVATWNFPVITPEQRNQLKTFCAGASAAVYIQTKMMDDTYDEFSAIMVWPLEEERKWGLRFGLTIEFRSLEAV